MVLRMARPTRRKEPSFIQFHKRIPADIQRKTSGQRITVTFPADVCPSGGYRPDQNAQRFPQWGGGDALRPHSPQMPVLYSVEDGFAPPTKLKPFDACLPTGECPFRRA